MDLYWLPLGAGQQVVRISGRVFEFCRAVSARRRPLDIYHAALEVFVPDGRFVIEIAPVPRSGSEDRGVIGTGPVGNRFAGHLRVFKYELHSWREGDIPDRAWAVRSPVTLTHSETVAQALLELLPEVPMPVWGLDELNAGEMWTSNSVIAWLLFRAGIPTSDLGPPDMGCAPGWDAGLVVARRGFVAPIGAWFRGASFFP